MQFVFVSMSVYICEDAHLYEEMHADAREQTYIPLLSFDRVAGCAQLGEKSLRSHADVGIAPFAAEQSLGWIAVGRAGHD